MILMRFWLGKWTTYNGNLLQKECLAVWKNVSQYQNSLEKRKDRFFSQKKSPELQFLKLFRYG